MNIELESEAPATPASEERHSRKCSICNHPDREAIDEAFLHWSSPFRIVRDHNLSSNSCLYRHAHACGLWLRRRSNIRFALDLIIEQAGDCRPTANAILRAIELSCRFDETGRYTEPKKKVTVEHHNIAPEPKANSNRESQRLENNATPTKQSPGPNSNREEQASRGGGSSPSRVSTGCFRNPKQPTRIPSHTQSQPGRERNPLPYNDAGELGSNRESQQLENNATPTKQTPDAQSNRELEGLLSATPKSVFTAEIQDMLLGRSQR